MNKVKLITEASHDFTINEGKDKSLYIEGLFSSTGVKNNNGRIYSKPIFKREVEKLVEKINNKSSLGELNHPTDRAEVDPKMAAIMLESLEWRDNNLYGRAKVLTTPEGQIVRSLINDGVRLGISSRGLGTVSEDGNVNEDYNLITYDVVSDPSNHGSWVNGIYEGKEFNYDILQVEEEISEAMIAEVKASHTRKIFQVLKDIEKNL